MNERTIFQAMSRRHVISLAPAATVHEAACVMTEHRTRHLPVLADNGKILGVFSVRDALPREVNTAVSLSEFNEQVNDSLG